MKKVVESKKSSAKETMEKSLISGRMIPTTILQLMPVRRT